MDPVKLNLGEKGEGAFVIMEGDEQLGEMVIAIRKDLLTVYHTGVLPKAEGKGLAKKLLLAMTDYARNNHLKVSPLCPYVHLQFTHHPEVYKDIWKR
ncbi:MAG: Acetyltransferase family protein [Segetibacter sp.]|jgi:predicted GNAT family acetyltransferase|nr:Acetyltransferase family protein [Segetibacter sp.]